MSLQNNTTPKVTLTVTQVRCVLGIKNDGNINGMINTQGKMQRLPIESHVVHVTAYANVRTNKKKGGHFKYYGKSQFAIK